MKSARSANGTTYALKTDAMSRKLRDAFCVVAGVVKNYKMYIVDCKEEYNVRGVAGGMKAGKKERRSALLDRVVLRRLGLRKDTRKGTGSDGKGGGEWRGRKELVGALWVRKVVARSPRRNRDLALADNSYQWTIGPQ